MTQPDFSFVSIRQAVQGDHVLLAEMGAETFFETFAPHNTPQDMKTYLEGAFHPKIQKAEMANPSSLFLIAEVDDEPVGYARLLKGMPSAIISGAHPIEIVRLYARSQWIGHKVGAALMTACLHEAKIRRCDVIWLDVWEKNVRAIRFYEKWGFKKVGTQPFRVGQDIQTDWLMSRPVEDPSQEGDQECQETQNNLDIEY